MPLTDRLPEPVRRRLRLLGWRARRPLAALCAGLAVLAAVGLLRPADPPTVRVPVAARDLALGAVLAARDVRVAELPRALVPAAVAGAAGPAGTGGPPPTPGPEADEGARTQDGVAPGTADGDRTAAPGTTPADAPVDALVGRRLAVPVPVGFPLVAELFVADAATGPPGTVVVPVRFADAGVAAVLAPGMRVDVVAAAPHDGDDATRLARSAVVLAPRGGAADTAGSGGGLLGGGPAASESPPVLLAVDPEDSVALSGATASRVLSAVIVE